MLVKVLEALYLVSVCACVYVGAWPLIRYLYESEHTVVIGFKSRQDKWLDHCSNLGTPQSVPLHLSWPAQTHQGAVPVRWHRNRLVPPSYTIVMETFSKCISETSSQSTCDKQLILNELVFMMDVF